MNEVYVGMVVHDSHGLIGSVVDVASTSADDQQIVIRRHDGTTQTLSTDAYTVHGDTLYITATSATADTANDPVRTRELSVQDVMELEDGETVTLPIVREEAVIRTQQVERGGVRIHKRVEEREESAMQPTLREEVRVERVPIGRAIESVPDVREEGDTLIIPVVEEILVVQKQLILKEEIRLTKHRFTQEEAVRVVLREEQVEVERLDDARRAEQM